MAAKTGLSASVARKVLQRTEASREQAAFFEAFLALVVEEVEVRCPGRFDAQLLAATDLSRLEYQITAEASMMTGLAANFLQQCGVPERDRLGTDRFRNVTETVRTDQASLWCRLKRIGSSSPVADVGFAVDREIDRRDCDVLVPQSEDLEALQKHALEEKCQSCVYGSSILPGVGAWAPTILEYNMAMVKSTKLLLSGLGFFRSLGFAKPDDAVIRQLSSCKPDKCMVRAFLTTDGLTQLSMRLYGSARLPVKETAKALNFAAQAERVKQVYDILGDNPDLMEYAMDAHGCSLAVGYTTPPSKTK